MKRQDRPPAPAAASRSGAAGPGQTGVDPGHSDTQHPPPGHAAAETPFEQWLDRKLQTVYGSVLHEPIPDDILQLLREKLDKPKPGEH